MTAVPAYRLAVVLLLLGPGDPCVGRQICLMLGLVDSWDLGGRGLWSEHRNVMCVKCCGWCVGDMTLLHCCFGRSTEWTECCMGVWVGNWGRDIPANGDLQLWSNIRSTRGYSSCCMSATACAACVSDAALQQLLLLVPMWLTPACVLLLCRHTPCCVRCRATTWFLATNTALWCSCFWLLLEQVLTVLRWVGICCSRHYSPVYTAVCPMCDRTGCIGADYSN
jgi:hypothetical protein